MIFVCALSLLKDPDALSEDEKAQCIDAAGPHGRVSPLLASRSAQRAMNPIVV